MNENLEKILQEYDKRLQEINNLKQAEETTKKTYKEHIKSITEKFNADKKAIQEKINTAADSLEEFSNSNKVNIRLGDILKEISNISNTP